MLAAGAPQERGGGSGINPAVVDASAPESGAVYVFERTGQGWRQSAYIKSADAAEYDSFGSAVALTADGTQLVVAAAGADGPSDTQRDAGAAYLFARAQPR